MAKRLRSSQRLQTEKDRSAMRLQKQQKSPGKQETTNDLLQISSTLSETQLDKAISKGYQLATLDALSMIRRKATQMRLNQKQV